MCTNLLTNDGSNPRCISKLSFFIGNYDYLIWLAMLFAILKVTEWVLKPYVYIFELLPRWKTGWGGEPKLSLWSPLSFIHSSSPIVLTMLGQHRNFLPSTWNRTRDRLHWSLTSKRNCHLTVGFLETCTL